MKALGLAFALAAAAAGTVENSWRWNVPADPVLIGAPIILEAAVEIPEGFRLLPLLDGQPTGSFEILETAGGKGLVHIQAAAFALGKQILPALRWTLKNDAGRIQTIESPPLTLTINPPKPGEGEGGELRDIKEPLDARLWPLLLAFAAAFLLIGALGYWFEKRRRPAGPAPAPRPTDTRSSEQIAYDELDALADLSLPVKEYYDRISDVLRAYFERRLSIPALTMTTHDLRRALVRKDADPKAREAIKALLDQCDLAKFARHLPTETESARAREDAKAIVGILAPKPVPEKAGTAS